MSARSNLLWANMHNSVRYQCHKEGSARRIRMAVQNFLLFAVCLSGVIPGHELLAQSKPATATTSPLCSRENALEMIKQQVDLTTTFNDSIRRIGVLIRAADLLWPYEHDKARAVFTEALDLAKEKEKENEQKGSRSLLLRLQIPDQRYVVIRAVAKRDPAWAKELTQQMLKSANAGEDSSTRGYFENLLTAARLLESATKMLATDINAAFDLARA